MLDTYGVGDFDYSNPKALFDYANMTYPDDDDGIGAPIELQRLSVKVADAVKKFGYTTKAFNLVGVSRRNWEKIVSDFPALGDLVKSAREELFEEIVIASRDRIVDGTLEGFIVHPETGEVYEKRNYHDSLVATLLKGSPVYGGKQEEAPTVTVTIRDLVGSSISVGVSGNTAGTMTTIDETTPDELYSSDANDTTDKE